MEEVDVKVVPFEKCGSVGPNFYFEGKCSPFHIRRIISESLRRSQCLPEQSQGNLAATNPQLTFSFWEKKLFSVFCFFFHVFLEIVVLTVENFLPFSSVFIIKYLDRMLFFPNSLQEWQMRRGRSKVCTDVYFLIWLEQHPGHRGEQLNLKYRCNTRNGTVDIWINLPTLPTNMKIENSLSLCW